MIKKGLIAMVAVVAAVGLVFAAYSDNLQENSEDSVIVQQPENDNSSDNGSTNSALISQDKAKQIAARYIEESGATVGTPKLVTSGDKKIYLVPVVKNGETIGEIEIDAETGKNLGGSGGAP